MGPFLGSPNFNQIPTDYRGLSITAISQREVVERSLDCAAIYNSVVELLCNKMPAYTAFVLWRHYLQQGRQ